MQVIETLTPAEATETLRALGMKASPDTLRLGLQQGVFPFGEYIAGKGGPVYHIYKRLFDAWIAERAIEKEVLT